MISRRSFLEASAVAGAGLMMPRMVRALAATKKLAPFVDALPIPPAIDLTGGGVINLAMAPGTHRFHRDLAQTTAWGYGGVSYLGPTIVAHRGFPVTVNWSNNLPNTHPLPIDTTIGWADPSGPGVPAVVHQHGGFTQPQFDGHPHQWFTRLGETGPYWLSNQFTYGNEQRAATLWYHDHAYGIDRLNVYMGLAAFYLLRDDDEDALDLPRGNFEIGLAIQDRIFNPDGSLFYSAATNGVPAPYPHPTWIPEFFGTTATVNGKVMPYLDVEPRRYRFRMLNGSNARFYNLWFDINNVPMPFHQIGTEQGFLGAAVPLTKLLIAPGERADIIFDFAGLPAGTLVTLMNNAKTPFPGGRGGSLPRIMQFRVTLPLSSADSSTPPAALVLPEFVPLVQSASTPTRDIMMTEIVDPTTGVPVEALLNNRHFHDAVDETPSEGATEVWQFINTTGDAHPMHMHLVSFQILNRQPFDAKAYLAAFAATGVRPALQSYLLGTPRPPAANEAGWKDTAQSFPGEVLRVIAKFDLPQVGSAQMPAGQTNPEYVFHCHILEHEENDMMRPYTVTPAESIVSAG